MHGENAEMRIELKRGLDITLAGAPLQRIEGTLTSSRIGVQPADFGGLRPRLVVAVGDRVQAGDVLFRDRHDPRIACTSLVSGRVVDIRRGNKRRICEVIVAREGNQVAAFPSHSANTLTSLPLDDLRDTLLRSGMWAALRARPHDCIASPAIEPRALFVTAIDTRPHAPDPAVVLHDETDSFVAGIKVLSRLSNGNTYVCVAPNSSIPVPECRRIKRLEFAGPHPAGLAGTHLHSVGLPITRDADLWHVGYQDVAAIGHLMLTGTVSARRVISLSGPGARHPRLVHAMPGLDLQQLSNEWNGPVGITVSGSPLDGVEGARYLGRYHNQVTLLPTETVAPHRGLRALFGSAVSTQASINLRTRRYGMLPLEVFERVWPYRSAPQALLRALLANDEETAERHGCLGLVEEDLALCNYVCPSRNEYGDALRRTLDAIESSR